MAASRFDAPDPEGPSEESVRRAAEALRLAGLNAVKLADIRAAAILNAMQLHDEDRDRAAESLGISRETLDIHLDGHGNGVLE
jgi:transcriptional regulator with PAS, ATPase and Fis domain